ELREPAMASRKRQATARLERGLEIRRYFTGDARRNPPRIETAHRCNRAASFAEALPCRTRTYSQRRDHPDAGNPCRVVHAASLVDPSHTANAQINVRQSAAVYCSGAVMQYRVDRFSIRSERRACLIPMQILERKPHCTSKTCCAVRNALY